MRVAVTALLLSLSAGAQAPAGSWPIVAAQSEVRIHVGKGGLFGFAGHEHEVQAPAVSGHVTFDPADLSKAEVQVTFDATAMKIDPAREPSGDAPKVQAVMLGPEVLDVARFPTIVYRSSGVKVGRQQGDRATLELAGQLTLHGQTRPLAASVAIVRGADTLRATGTVKLKQTDFGIKPVTAGGGTVRVKDEVEIRFTLVAARPAGTAE